MCVDVCERIVLGVHRVVMEVCSFLLRRLKLYLNEKAKVVINPSWESWQVQVKQECLEHVQTVQLENWRQELFLATVSTHDITCNNVAIQLPLELVAYFCGSIISVIIFQMFYWRDKSWKVAIHRTSGPLLDLLVAVNLTLLEQSRIHATLSRKFDC